MAIILQSRKIFVSRIANASIDQTTQILKQGSRQRLFSLRLQTAIGFAIRLRPLLVACG